MDYIDIGWTLLLGCFGIWSREIYQNFDDKHPISTYPSRFILMAIPGMFCGFLGGELSSLAGGDSYSWLFSLVLGYSGPQALEMITQGVLSLMKKAMEGAGVKFNECGKDETIPETPEPRFEKVKIKPLNETTQNYDGDSKSSSGEMVTV